ncbi:nucleotide sugar dehydrogenase [Alicyclobacillus fastidiosus]|uniref:Nucleotide sugar dehydrogenase n=1 Tax=Alicyclobacillus fastidiosus TaxID=392011 RepID=A0ABY6ZKY5_9BACL|nr:nucleotide sugar dehydrogenase [Alicyclobacillus fastidiosus]WAH42764.1 nucleotide sugar dehydrogenase [Alicyclobacillus fastidiosus]GMA64676.1 NDP-sugar dehydrogenase [Alicyclobacillus fastidiosus]
MRETIGVIGLGYIGLPLAMCLCERGFRVVGIDVDEDKVADIQAGRTDVQEDYLGQTLSQMLQRHIAEGNFVASSRPAVAAWECTTYFVTVGIPVHPETKSLNQQPLLDAMRSLGRVIKPHDLVIIRSTVVPGTVESHCVPLLEETSRMVAGVDFHVAYAAERVAEGRAMEEFQTLDIVAGGLTVRCAALAAQALQKLTDGQVHITDMRVAQLSKVIENAQRDVSLALVYELQEVAKSHHVNLYELIQMVNTHPRVNLLWPSVGVGGYCIPNAYHYLSASLQAERTDLPLFRLARQSNESVPRRIAQGVAESLHQSGRQMATAVVAVLGLGMKDGSNDIRQSPAIRCVEEFRSLGAMVRAYDPFVSPAEPYQVSTVEECLRDADAIVVGAWHNAFDELDWGELFRLVNQAAPVILVDPRGRLEARVLHLNPAPVLQRA